MTAEPRTVVHESIRFSFPTHPHVGRNKNLPTRPPSHHHPRTSARTQPPPLSRGPHVVTGPPVSGVTQTLALSGWAPACPKQKETKRNGPRRFSLLRRSPPAGSLSPSQFPLACLPPHLRSPVHFQTRCTRPAKPPLVIRPRGRVPRRHCLPAYGSRAPLLRPRCLQGGPAECCLPPGCARSSASGGRAEGER